MGAARHLEGVSERLRGRQAYAPDPLRDWLRMLGGLAFAIGAVVLFLRKNGGAEEAADWAAFPLLLVVLVPCTLLYALGVQAARIQASGQPWQAVLLVAAVLLAPLVLFQFLDVVGGSADDSLNQAWIFAATAAFAGYAAFRLGASYQALLGSLALVYAWLALGDKVLDSPSTGAFRVLLILAAIALVAGSVLLRERDMPQAPELVTAAGISAVLAGLLGAFESASELAGGLLGGEVTGDGQSAFWDVVVLAVSLVLVGYGARVGARGPAYVGAVGLIAFTLLVGLELSGLIEGDAEHRLVGWPLLLLLAGAAALAAGVGLGPRERGGRARGGPARSGDPSPQPMEGAPPSPATDPPAGERRRPPEPPHRAPWSSG